MSCARTSMVCVTTCSVVTYDLHGGLMRDGGGMSIRKSWAEMYGSLRGVLIQPRHALFGDLAFLDTCTACYTIVRVYPRNLALLFLVIVY